MYYQPFEIVFGCGNGVKKAGSIGGKNGLYSANNQTENERTRVRKGEREREICRHKTGGHAQHI